ncbi:MAG: TldD/PmbA family protein [Deltaproteobacteria bacterium]|nr:MAG: TldD/PmbA family protein [Deltaproteobacteria bacterium]
MEIAADDPTDLLEEALAGHGEGFVELRFHRRRSRSIAVEKGRVDQARISEHTGVGVRVLADGTWGFASTDRLALDTVRRAVERARQAARAAAPGKDERVPELPPVELARGRFESDGYAELLARPLEESLQTVIALEARARGASSAITSAACGYNEIFEEKGVVTSDGAKAWSRLVRPEFRIHAVAQKDGEIQTGMESVGVTGSWDCLFRQATPESLTEKAAQQAVDLLRAGYPEGGRKRVILSPSLVGLLTHEAIGHTVEADFVLAGSCAAGKLGTQVASELVTMCDSGQSEYYDGAGGTLYVDDEGVPTGRTVLIENGILRSYLHDRESAARFEVAPTGNARAWEYHDEPLIRMRNTYIVPGAATLEEMIADIEDGYLLDGPANGQADSNGEFMFGTREAYRIQNGKLGPLLRGVNISGTAFDVMRTVDAVGREFKWDLGSGYCGKGQPAKVDAGGPWLSCQVIVGGRSA